MGRRINKHHLVNAPDYSRVKKLQLSLKLLYLFGGCLHATYGMSCGVVHFKAQNESVQRWQNVEVGFKVFPVSGIVPTD